MTDPNHKIINANCMDAMADMDENSVHAVVTDPPYGLNFMPQTTNGWDDFEPKEYQEWCEEWASEALRVLKPGGHLIAFSGNRTEHRLKTGIEDAGFVIRDTITYLYGTGFPKGSDIGKYIDRYHDAEDEREVVGMKRGYSEGRNASNAHEGWQRPWMDNDPDRKDNYQKTAPATSEAEKWDGWRTQLKPAVEFAVLARAPMRESAVYRNVLEHGTGALNIDRTRIPTDEDTQRSAGTQSHNEGYEGGPLSEAGRMNGGHSEGRYPANLLLDGVAARMLDSQSGDIPGSKAERGDPIGVGYHGCDCDERSVRGYDDSGGASRFFYTSKSSKRERTIDGQIDNEHPTVKPLDLMEYLVTLVTAPGQTVLDPFAGSGTTIMACRRLNRDGIGIEQDAGHADLARQRVDLAHELDTDRDDSSPEETTGEPGEDNGSNEGQQGLDVFTAGGTSE